MKRTFLMAAVVAAGVVCSFPAYGGEGDLVPPADPPVVSETDPGVPDTPVPDPIPDTPDPSEPVPDPVVPEPDPIPDSPSPVPDPVVPSPVPESPSVPQTDPRVPRVSPARAGVVKTHTGSAIRSGVSVGEVSEVPRLAQTGSAVGDVVPLSMAITGAGVGLLLGVRRMVRA